MDAPVLLSGSLDQYRAQSLKEELLAAVSASPADQAGLLLDMSAVEHLDASCLQVLLACRLAQKLDKLRISGASPAIQKWFCIAGADQLFSFSNENQ